MAPERSSRAHAIPERRRRAQTSDGGNGWSSSRRAAAAASRRRRRGAPGRPAAALGVADVLSRDLPQLLEAAHVVKGQEPEQSSAAGAGREAAKGGPQHAYGQGFDLDRASQRFSKEPAVEAHHGPHAPDESRQ